MPVILYEYPGADGVGSISPPCLKIELALNLIGAPFEIKYCTPASARKKSPTGRLPALRFDDGAVVEDSILIMDALELRHSEAGLAPQDPGERLADRLWETFANDHLYWYGFWLRWVDPEIAPAFYRETFGRMPWYSRMMIRTFFLPLQRRRSRYQGFYGKSAETVHAAVRRALDMAAQGIGDGPFLQERSTPARGDLALASFTVQTGFRDTMPRVEKEALARPAVLRHAIATYEACGVKPTRWLESMRARIGG